MIVSRALIQAVRPLADHGEPVRLAPSGGRDSRLMAAVLHAAGVPFHGPHTATLMNSPYYHPFFDNRVVREFLALPAETASPGCLACGFPCRHDRRLRVPFGVTWKVRRWPGKSATTV